MPVNKIDIGQAANDGTGDTLRDAFGKINDNFDTLVEAVAARLIKQWAFAPLRHEHDDTVPRYIGNSVPSEPPPTFGAMWVNIADGKIYFGTGTASVADWREIIFAQPSKATRGPAK